LINSKLKTTITGLWGKFDKLLKILYALCISSKLLVLRDILVKNLKEPRILEYSKDVALSILGMNKQQI